MMLIAFELRGGCGVPDGTTAADGFANHLSLPGRQIVSIQLLIEMASDADTDEHRDLPYDRDVALDLRLGSGERTLDLDDDSG